MSISNPLNTNLDSFFAFTINGVSLTIAKILKYGFQISIIPQTLRLTNLIYLKEKDLVNVEFDILGKYIKNVMK